MRRSIIILSILFLTGAVWGETHDETTTILSGNQAALLEVQLAAGSPPVTSQSLPFEFECHADNKIEHDLCSALWTSVDSNKFATLEFDRNLPYFNLVILPVARDGYISIAVASSFVYPPLNGLSLSAYLGGFIILPDGVDDEVTDEIIKRVVIGTSKWMIGAEENILRIPPLKPLFESESKELSEVKNG